MAPDNLESRIPALADTSRTAAIEWLQTLENKGLLMHPDDDPNQILASPEVDARGDDGKLFSALEGQHTPGPWRLNEDCARTVRRDHALDVEIAWCGEAYMYSAGAKYRINSDEAAANARLIAAAPDLLEALQRLLATVRMAECYDEYQAAEVAIAKALRAPSNT